MRTSFTAFVFAALSACAGGGDDPPTPDAQSNPGVPVCGDGTCAAAEVGACAQDCGSSATPVCGNQMCENGETVGNCPNDCSTGVPVCGDMTCDMAGGENSTNCPGDCGGNQGGTLNCEDPETLLGCFCVVIDPSTCAPPFTEQACNVCLGM
jgi:hypothetical protein